MAEILTRRLLLRPITKRDEDDIFDYAKNPNVGPNAGWKPHDTKEETRQVMNEMFLGADTVFGIVPKDTGKLIGTMGLLKDPKRQFDKAMMLGYAIGEPYWGKGLTTEAAKALIQYGFDALGLEVISSYCYPHNHRSRRVIEKIGMRYEGVLRKAEKLFDGRLEDNLCFSLTALEYRSL